MKTLRHSVPCSVGWRFLMGTWDLKTQPAQGLTLLGHLLPHLLATPQGLSSETRKVAAMGFNHEGTWSSRSSGWRSVDPSDGPRRGGLLFSWGLTLLRPGIIGQAQSGYFSDTWASVYVTRPPTLRCRASSSFSYLRSAKIPNTCIAWFHNLIHNLIQQNLMFIDLSVYDSMFNALQNRPPLG